MEKLNYNIKFEKRALFCFLLCMILFFVTVLRVAAVATADYTAVTNTQNGIRLTIGNSRGTIFDCNNVPITNNKEKIIAAVSPTPRAVTAISSVLSGEELQNALERLKSGKPILCELPRTIECDGIVCTKVYDTENLTAKHLLGYTDYDNKGVSGIQAAYDKLLYCEDDISIYYETDAKGRILEGISPTLTNPQRNATHGVVTTIDINIQAIAESEAKSLTKGAIVIADAENGKIRACVSQPDFDINNISKYLSDESSPLLNRATNAYNVGSVFKPCVATAGIESGKSTYNYTCTGSCEIIDRFFKCHNRSGHGLLNLKKALAFSCNTYFYNYAFHIGAEEIYKTAKNFSFGEGLKLCEGIKTAKGNLPQEKNLKNIAYLANFSIGQGELLLSPVSILPLYCSIATNGEYYIPSVVEGTIENGSFKAYNKGAPTKGMTANTAKILRRYLKSVLTEGTGETAMPKTVSAAGKTATAQTGKYKNGVEICQGWFCGFFPAEKAEYVVIVFSEDITAQTKSCGEIFASIADSITAIH